MVCSVERAYLTSVEELRDICMYLSHDHRGYRIVRCDEDEVAISYNDSPADDLNALCFTFPILPYPWGYGLPGLIRGNVEACRMVCLHVFVGRQIRDGIYPDGDKLWKDGIADWERFWPRLEAALVKGMER